MQLFSRSFANNGVIPDRLTFGRWLDGRHIRFGGNRNPQLEWSGLPSATRSLVVYGSEQRHGSADAPLFLWGLADLPPGRAEIREGELSNGVVVGGKVEIPGPWRQVLNDYTELFTTLPDLRGCYRGYDGPCLGGGDTRGRIVSFTLLALDVARAPVVGTVSCHELLRAVAPHVLARASTSCLHGDAVGVAA